MRWRNEVSKIQYIGNETVRVEKAGTGWDIYVGAKKKSVKTWTDVLIFLSALHRDERRT